MPPTSRPLARSPHCARFLDLYRLELVLAALFAAQLVGLFADLVGTVESMRAIFLSMNVELPWATRSALQLSRFATESWFLAVPMGAYLSWVLVWRATWLDALEGYRGSAAYLPSYRGPMTVRLLLALGLTWGLRAGIDVAMKAPMIKIVNGVG